MLRRNQVLCSILLCAVLVGFALGDNSSLQTKCMNDFTKLTDCLDYATAKTDTPSSACCGDAQDIRGSDPVCLCYIIQQAHNGSSQGVQQLGLRVDRLLMLPAACKLRNTNITMCTKLLNLSRGSPDYDLFMNATKATPSSSSSSSSSPSSGFMIQMRLHSTIAVALVSAIFSSIF